MSKKVTVVFNSTKAESLVSGALALAYSQGETITTINLVQMSSANIDSAIAAVAADQDFIYVAATTATDISSGQVAALTAKLMAVTGVLEQWQATDRGSGGVSMSMQAWYYFNNAHCSPSDVINYMGNTLAKLTDAEEIAGTYLSAALVGKYNIVDPDDDSITFNDKDLKSIASVLDAGIMSIKLNSCAQSNSPHPMIDSLLLHDLEVAGEIAVNALNIYLVLNGS